MCLSGEGPLKGKEVLWEIKVKVSDGFSDETYHLVSFINEDDEIFDFKEIV